CAWSARLEALRPPSISSSWFPESATEWIASASIEADPESAHAMNFATAMPRFARSAATIALLPPDALMAPSLRRSPSRAEGHGPGRARLVGWRHGRHAALPCLPRCRFDGRGDPPG